MTAYRFSLYRVLTSTVFVSDSNDITSCCFDETNGDKEAKRIGDEEIILFVITKNFGLIIKNRSCQNIFAAINICKR